MLGPHAAVPSNITFDQAIALTQSLLSQIAAAELQPDEIESAIAQLVKSENGARGFFVTYLTSEQELADDPAPEVVRALQSSPEIVAELLVKNLAMSAAMAVTHRRHLDEAMAQNSERVRSRTTHLIQLVQLPAVNELSQQMWESAATGEGNYKAFLQRWGYDAEQRLIIGQTLTQVLPKN
ncbi:MAG: hypothetical protein JOZ78_04575 [Chroococcidiopsidaceae cyanobacterium CP_BM_ER_R8_30]|nr:hypothetical protein [Chroococcidiopsidaceae cyanobacterium CP_BM_ER_R8_30]